MQDYGKIIKRAREAKGMTQQKLADQWPRAKQRGVGCSLQYVQSVESGSKSIDDSNTLRGLCTLLNIPPWKFGFDEYDPSHPLELPKTRRLIDATLDMAEYLISKFEHTYRTDPLPVAASDAKQLHDLFEFICQNQPPTVQNEHRFLKLYAQVHNLDGVILLGYSQYDAALTTFQEMYKLAALIDDPTMLAHSLLTIGTELERAGKENVKLKIEAVEHLEKARDYTFNTSKDVTAYVHAYLSRCYSSIKDANRFQRAINTAKNIAPKTYGTGKDFVYHPFSGILAEESHGYLEAGLPQKTLDMRKELEEQTKKDKNNRLAAWIPLDWARAYKMIGEIEQSVQQGRVFYYKAQELETPHIVKRAREFAEELYQENKDVAAAKDLYEEVHQ